MSELSIFIDESGDFGEYDFHSPYYIITMVFHNQDADITKPMTKLEQDLSRRGFPNHCVHTGPIIRRENEYEFLSIEERRRILNCMVTFIKHIDVRYRCVHIEKKHIEDPVQAVAKLSKQISQFIKDHYTEFLGFHNVKIYYDNGQVEVTKLLASVFSTLLPRVEIRKVMPSDYRLFQAADTNSSNGGQKLCCSDYGCFFDVPQFFPGNECPSCHVGTLHIYHELIVVDEYEAYL